MLEEKLEEEREKAKNDVETKNEVLEKKHEERKKK